MNLSKSAFRRYKVIDNLLRNKMRRYPDMEEIIEECNDKLCYRPKPETIQKDIANMKMPYPDGFDAPIYYNRARGGYEYTDLDYSITGVSLRYDELEAVQEAVEIIRAIGGSRISEQFNHSMEKLLSATLESGVKDEKKIPVLQTMIPPISRGFEYFDLFYRACREKIPVSLIHFSYKKRKFDALIIHPFLIKEFENRWYVIGYSEKHKEIRTFGLDRINQPILLKKKFNPSDIHAIRSYLEDVYGVFPIPGMKKEKIDLHVSQLGTHYFQAYPLHESQKIVKNKSGTSTISYELIPSLELARFFLGQGHHVQVKCPVWFNQFIKDLTK